MSSSKDEDDDEYSPEEENSEGEGDSEDNSEEEESRDLGDDSKSEDDKKIVPQPIRSNLDMIMSDIDDLNFRLATQLPKYHKASSFIIRNPINRKKVSINENKRIGVPSLTRSPPPKERTMKRFFEATGTLLNSLKNPSPPPVPLVVAPDSPSRLVTPASPYKSRVSSTTPAAARYLRHLYSASPSRALKPLKTASLLYSSKQRTLNHQNSGNCVLIP